MTDAIIRTSGDCALSLNGGLAVVTARTYHLARTTADSDSAATLTLLPGNWVAAATQTDPGPLPGGALRSLVQHVASLHGALRVADTGNVAELLKGIAAGATPNGTISYGSPKARDHDIARTRIR